jgi:tRNA modification GTPase
VDSSIPLDESDAQIMEMIRDKKTIILLNKSDLPAKIDENELEKKWNEICFNQSKKEVCNDEAGNKKIDNIVKCIIRTSVKDRIGMDIFEEKIKEMFFQGDISVEDEIYITSLRQKEALLDVKNSLLLVNQSLLDDMPEDFYSIDLMSAYASLGKIIGEEVEDDLVQEIFSKFCMGK